MLCLGEHRFLVDSVCLLSGSLIKTLEAFRDLVYRTDEVWRYTRRHSQGPTALLATQHVCVCRGVLERLESLQGPGHQS